MTPLEPVDWMQSTSTTKRSSNSYIAKQTAKPARAKKLYTPAHQG